MTAKRTIKYSSSSLSVTLMYYFCCSILLLLQLSEDGAAVQFNLANDNNQLLVALHIFGHNIDQLLADNDKHGKQMQMHSLSGRRNSKGRKVFPSADVQLPENPNPITTSSVANRLETFFRDLDEFMEMTEKIGRHWPKDEMMPMPIRCCEVDRARKAANAETIREFMPSRSKSEFDQIVNGLEDMLVQQKHGERTAEESEEGKQDDDDADNVDDRITREITMQVRGLRSKIAAFIDQIRMELAYGPEWQQLGEELRGIMAELNSNLAKITEQQKDRIMKKEEETTIQEKRAKIEQIELKWQNLGFLSRASNEVAQLLGKICHNNNQQQHRSHFNRAYGLVEKTILPILHQIGGSSRYAGIPEMVSVEPQKLSDWLHYEAKFRAKLEERQRQRSKLFARIRAKFQREKEKHAEQEDWEALFESRIMVAATKVLVMFESARTLLMGTLFNKAVEAEMDGDGIVDRRKC